MTITASCRPTARSSSAASGAARPIPAIGSSSAPYDTNFLPIEQGLLFIYDYNRSLAVYHCPADKSTVRLRNGQNTGLPRTRSYSMSGCLGGRTNEVQNTVSRAGDIPDAVRLFVFIDENQDSINDAHFLTWPAPDERWVNMPPTGMAS